MEIAHSDQADLGAAQAGSTQVDADKTDENADAGKLEEEEETDDLQLTRV